MAVKLEKTKTMSGDSRYSIKLTVTEKTVTSADIDDNSTRVDYKLEATKSSGSGYYSNNAINPIKVTLDGTTIVNTKKTYDFRNSTPKTITLASGTHTIKHDPDGSKTIACSGYFKDADNSLGNATASGNLTLTQLHTPPVITGYSITETNSVLTNIGVSNNQFVGYLSNKRINITYNLDEDTQYQSALVYFEGGSQIDWNNALPITANFANFHPAPVNNYLNLCVSVTDDKNTTSYYSNASGSTQTRQGLDSYAYIPYIIPTFNSSSNAKRDGQLTGKVKLNITGTYYNGEIGSGANKVNQGGNYKPTIKYKFWKVGESQPSTYAYTIPGPSITTSNGTFTISNYQIGSADDQATNYFNPSFSYRVKIYIQDTFKSSESPELSIPVGEAVWTEYKDRVDFKKLTIQNVEVTPGGGGAGDYENLINKPEINGVTLSGDKTASQLGFASVATSGSYNDLSNKPAINNGTLTIQKNGTTVKTFTANASSNVTANITVPTKTGDLTNNGDGTSGYKYINDIGKDGLYYGDSELKGIGVYEDDHIYFKSINGNHEYIECLANNSDVPIKTSQLTNDSGYTTNTGTITGIKMNGASKGTSGVVDLGTVITSHQTIKTINNTSMTGSGNVSVQPTLVSGTNIKTINNTSLLGSGNITIGSGGTATDVQVNGTSITSGGVANLVTQSAYNSSTNKIATYNDVTGYHDSTKQATLVSGTNIKTINSTSLLGSGNVAVQPTLVSGTNIKTINSTSLLGSGNIAVQSTLSTSTGTLSITKTSGNSTCTGTYARYGNVVSLDLELKTTGTINSGSDVFVGKITSFTPKKTGELVGYYGARPIIAGYGTDQVITVRNAGTSNIGSGNTLDIRGIVIV